MSYSNIGHQLHSSRLCYICNTGSFLRAHSFPVRSRRSAAFFRYISATVMGTPTWLLLFPGVLYTRKPALKAAGYHFTGGRLSHASGNPYQRNRMPGFCNRLPEPEAPFLVSGYTDPGRCFCSCLLYSVCLLCTG